ncbi:MAG: hypothetical protein WA865_08365 [Spirulinaceae cyanobacterium]
MLERAVELETPAIIYFVGWMGYSVTTEYQSLWYLMPRANDTLYF